MRSHGTPVSIQNWEETGDSLEAELPVGEQVITANARLPNGDRLSYAIGGILVQHPDAGTYVGTTSIDLTINADRSLCGLLRRFSNDFG